MTNYDINRTLAEFMGIDWGKYLKWCYDNFEPIDERHNYCENRDDLAEVLAKLTDDQKYRLHYNLFWRKDTLTTPEGFSLWLLTCNPRIIAQAVAEVVKSPNP